MNPRIVVGGIIGAFAIVILVAGGFIGGGVIDDVSGGSIISSPSSSGPEIFPLVIELEDVTVVEIEIILPTWVSHSKLLIQITKRSCFR